MSDKPKVPEYDLEGWFYRVSKRVRLQDCWGGSDLALLLDLFVLYLGWSTPIEPDVTPEMIYYASGMEDSRITDLLDGLEKETGIPYPFDIK